MSKRRNENGQMRREEWEAEDRDGGHSDEGGMGDGGFVRASDDAIRARKIVKARPMGAAKKANGVATPAPAVPASTAAVKANAFAGFSDLTAAKPAVELVAKANPFASFTGLTAPPPSTATASFSSASSKTPSTYQKAIEVLNKEFLEFVSGQLQKNPNSDWTCGVEDYLKHAQQIATKFATSKPVPVVSALSAKPTSLPSSTLPSFLSAPQQPKQTESVLTPPSSGFSFGAKPTTDESPPKSSFSFGSAKPAPAASTDGFSFTSKPTEPPTLAVPAFAFGSASTASPKDTKAATPAFSFGSTPATESKPATSGFSFGGTTTATPPAATSGFSFNLAKPAPAASGFSFNAAPTAGSLSGGFSFGSTPTAPLTSAGAATAEGDDEDEENIGREEATVILKADNPDEDTVFEADKAKVLEFKKDENRWADKGTHALKVLINPSTKNARILIRNEIGKIVLNTALYKGLVIKPQETKGKKTGALMPLQVDGSVTQYILKVNSEKVDKFIAALDQATPT